MTDTPTYRFADVSVDLGRVMVTKAGLPVELEPKAFDVLRVLIERRDRLVTKDELMTAVWGDAFVTPNVLTRVIAQLRKALDDDAHDARFIETVPTRGYRFIGQVTGATEAKVTAPPATPPAAVTTPPAAAPARKASPVVLAGLAVLAIALLAALWLRRPGDAATDEPPPAPSRVTISSGANTQPAISPDGSSVAFVSDRNGNVEIYVSGLARGSREIALTADGGQNVNPDWSPDGKWIAFHSRRRSGIWVVPSTGGVPVQVAEVGAEPSWAPDSESIVFSTSQGSMSAQGTIAIVGRDGNGLRQLTRAGDPVGGHHAPAWSHNGTLIAFTVSQGTSRSDLWTIPVTGGSPQHVVGSELASDPVFAADDRLLYFGGLTTTTRGIYRVAIDPADGRPRGDAVEVAPFSSGTVGGLSISRAGLLAYGITNVGSNLWSVDLAADGAPLESRAVTNQAVRASKPSYSPDGRRLAFVQFGNGLESSTWVMNDDGTGREPLVVDGMSGEPTWGPDANVFIQLGPATTQSFVLVSAETRRTQALPKLPTQGVRNPRLSPSGREVAYWMLEPSGAMNSWIQPIDSTMPRRITSDAEAINYPAWSPDGEWLAVEIKRGETTSVGIVSRRGGPVRQLTSEPGQSWPHSWSPDGERIAYAGERGGVWNIYAVSRRTGQSQQLTRFESPSGYVRYPDWSPRGNRIVFERQIDEGNVWVLPTSHPGSR